jgi:CRISPR/Cas system-associated protein endoribonuclease Cas2
MAKYGYLVHNQNKKLNKMMPRARRFSPSRGNFSPQLLTQKSFADLIYLPHICAI